MYLFLAMLGFILIFVVPNINQMIHLLISCNP
nr:MAG TPA: hypothetical protein [Caudoviricetes sp.]